MDREKSHKWKQSTSFGKWYFHHRIALQFNVLLIQWKVLLKYIYGSHYNFNYSCISQTCWYQVFQSNTASCASWNWVIEMGCWDLQRALLLQNWVFKVEWVRNGEFQTEWYASTKNSDIYPASQSDFLVLIRSTYIIQRLCQKECIGGQLSNSEITIMYLFDKIHKKIPTGSAT